MIRFTDFRPVPVPALTKVKFNIRAGVGGPPAWDLLLADDPEDWLDVNRHRERNPSKNLDKADYLLSFALWQRWAGYAHLGNLTSGNKELERTRAEFGDGHIVDNFRYSILGIFDPKTKAETILRRESFWKLALDSRAHGDNHN